MEFVATEVTELAAEGPYRSALFDRLDAFRFVGPSAGRMLTRRLDIGAVTLGLVESTGHDIGVVEPSRATFLAPIQGRVGVSWRQGDLTAQGAGTLLLQHGRRMTHVRPDRAGRFAAALALAPAGARSRGLPPLPGRLGDRDDRAMLALRRYLTFVVGELIRPGSPLARPAALQAVEAAVLDLFAAIEVEEAPPDRVALPAEARVREVEEIMRARAAEALTVADLARAVGVGPRALQLAFQAHRGASPRAVLAGLRMERAREMLRGADPEASVTDIALAAGFTHLGRFAGAYRARFGETPIQTLRRGRGPMTGGAPAPEV
jgi:AraC-like DNA-binding protein